MTISEQRVYSTSCGAIIRDGQGRNKRFFGDYEIQIQDNWEPVTIEQYEIGMLAGLQVYSIGGYRIKHPSTTDEQN